MALDYYSHPKQKQRNKMGIFSKITDIINSNLNHILDKAQDPIKMANLMINEMEDTLVELKSNMARVMAEQKTLHRNMNRVQDDLNFYTNKAEMAVSEGQEELARKVIEQSIAEEKKIELLKKRNGELEDELQSYREDLLHLEEKIHEARDRLQSLKSRADSAKSKKKVGDHLEKARKQMDLSRFDVLENQIDRLESEGQIEMKQQKNLKQEIAEMEHRKEVDARLAALKQK
jgi:phage shock protein A